MEEEEEESCFCWDCPFIKIATKYEKNKDEQSILDLETGRSLQMVQKIIN